MGLQDNRSSVRFRVDVNPGIKHLDEILEFNIRDMAKLRDRIDVKFRGFMRSQFSTQGASGGEPWQALSPKYEKWKKRKHPGKKIMALTGKTRKSLTSKTNADHVAIYRLKPRPAVEVGTSHKTPAYHSPFSPLKNPRLPDRDVIQTTATQDTLLITPAIEAIQTKMRQWVRTWGDMKRARAGGA